MSGVLLLWLARRSERGLLRRNPIAGVRTTLTLSSDVAWYPAQRAASPKTRVAAWGGIDRRHRDSRARPVGRAVRHQHSYLHDPHIWQRRLAAWVGARWGRRRTTRSSRRPHPRLERVIKGIAGRPLADRPTRHKCASLRRRLCPLPQGPELEMLPVWRHAHRCRSQMGRVGK